MQHASKQCTIIIMILTTTMVTRAAAEGATEAAAATAAGSVEAKKDYNKIRQKPEYNFECVCALCSYLKFK